VTEVIYDTNTPLEGGTLLGSATFTPIANTFSGGSFSPISLTAGHTYFLGFENTLYLGVNVTSDVGATYLSELRYGDPPFSFTEAGYFTGQPILEFASGSTVPEPASLIASAGMGTMGLIAYGWKKRGRLNRPSVSAAT